MTRDELKLKILAAYSDKEWEMLRQDIQRAADPIRQEFPEALILSNESCDRCKKCTWPDSPCRFPDKCFHSIEGYGFLVSELAQRAGIRYLHGPGSVTFFGAVFYNRH